MQAISICFSNLWSVTIALLSCLYDFEHPSATDPLQTEAWARMFYVPSTPWTIVLPINHILCRVPLMRLFLEGSDAPTIPHSFAREKAQYFQYGCADQPGRKNVGSGSSLFELTVHLWQFARPQPRTMSVSERFEKRQEAARAAHTKRECGRKSTMHLKGRGGRILLCEVTHRYPAAPPSPPFRYSSS